MATFHISGRVIDYKTGCGVTKLRVEAWDKDLIYDDLVGSTITDEQGAFQLEFDESYFQEIFLEKRPDLFFRIFQENELIKSTEDSVLWNVAAGNTEVLIELGTGETGEIGPLIGEERSQAATALRIDAAEKQQEAFITDHPNNGDEERFADQNYIGSYTKGLPHDGVGEVDPKAYCALIKALKSGQQADFDVIPLGCTVPERAQIRLVCPQAAYAYQFEGQDSHGLTMRPAPAFDSAEESGEMAEVYWQALTRDVPFSQYDTDPLTIAAANSLSDNYSDFRGPKENGRVTTRTLFRVNTPGDLAGPLVSQFLYQPFILGALPVEQRYRTTTERLDYMTDFDEYLKLQNGCMPGGDSYIEGTRFIYSSRSLGEYIHRDPPLSHFYYAASILLNYGSAALDPGNPYISNPTQQGFVTFGLADLTDISSRIAVEALKAAWYQKWLVHRRLRPEVYAGWIDNIKSGRDTDYPVNEEILADTDLLERVFDHNKAQNLNFGRGTTGSYLLPMSYPEGSPLHPAYPSGHATYGGAGVTVLKAIFNEDFEIPNPLVANDDGTALLPYSGTLTVGGELNKLASNVGYARDFTGVHWRTDGTEGQLLGEAVAIAFLQDRIRTYNEDFPGYTLTKFNGQKIRINPDGTITNL